MVTSECTVFQPAQGDFASHMLPTHPYFFTQSPLEKEIELNNFYYIKTILNQIYVLS